MNLVVNTALIVFSLLNLAFAGAVYAHNRRNIRVIFYALISVFASLWSISTLLTGLNMLPLWQFKLALYGHYIFGYGAYLSGFWFAYLYPTRSKFSITWSISISIVTISLLSFIPTHYFFLDIHEGITIADKVIFNYLGHGIFISIISVVYFMVVWQLAQKLREANQLNKKEISSATIEFFLVGLSGIALNLVFPLYGNFSFFYITPFVQTIILTGIGLYNLGRFHMFNAKIVLAEFFTGGMCIISIARLAISTSNSELITNGLLLVGTVGFGIFLIRSVTKEIEQREEIQRLAESLKAANEKLKELDKLKSQFLSIASHDLRSPLTVIRNFMSLLLEGTYGKLPPAGEEGLRQVFERATDMAKSVDTYLNVSRIEQGKMKYDFVEADLVKMVKDAVAGYKIAAEQKGLTLNMSLGAAMDTIPVKVDRANINEVLNNLLDNAIKYTPKGSVYVSLEKRPPSLGSRLRSASDGQVGRAGGDMARISIKDSGKGIKPGEKNSIFQKFTRGQDSLYQSSGLGLGLYVAQLIVQMHKGQLAADSEGEGRGATFMVTLPIKNGLAATEKK